MTKCKNRAGKMLKMSTFLEWLQWMKKGKSSASNRNSSKGGLNTPDFPTKEKTYEEVKGERV